MSIFPHVHLFLAKRSDSSTRSVAHWSNCCIFQQQVITFSQLRYSLFSFYLARFITNSKTYPDDCNLSIARGNCARKKDEDDFFFLSLGEKWISCLAACSAFHMCSTKLANTIYWDFSLFAVLRLQRWTLLTLPRTQKDDISLFLLLICSYLLAIFLCFAHV